MWPCNIYLVPKWTSDENNVLIWVFLILFVRKPSTNEEVLQRLYGFFNDTKTKIRPNKSNQLLVNIGKIN